METQSEQKMQTDVVVVGGGMAGLTAASYLARAGVPVTVFEKAAGLGGRSATQDHNGYKFNRGIHAFYTGGAASEVFQELGITYSYGLPKKVGALLQNGQLKPFPTNLMDIIRTDLLSAGDKLEFVGLMATLIKIKPQTVAHLSVRQWLDQTIKRSQVKRLMEAFGRTYVYSSALDLVSAEVYVDKLQRSLKHPVHYIDGGWQTLVNALRQTAEDAGARILSGARVDSVELRDGVVKGVRLRGGNLLPATAVIVATDPGDAVKLIDEQAYPGLRQIVDSLIPARVACLDVALSRLPSPPRYPVVLNLDGPCFLSTQSSYARVAPQGGALICAFKQLDPRYPSNPDEDKRDLEGFLDIAQPGWRNVLVKSIFLPHIEASGTLPTAHDGGFAGRPGPRVPGLTNLYLAGDWIGSEGFLIDASIASARQAVRLVLQEGLLTQKRLALLDAVQ